MLGQLARQQEPYSSLYLLRAGVLSHRLGTLRDCMLGQLARQQEPYSSLYLPRSDGRPLVVVSELARLCSNPLEEIVDKGVHDAHGLGGHASVGVNLLQHLVNVDGVRLLPLALLLFLVPLGHSLSGFAGLDGSLPRSLRWHRLSLKKCYQAV